MTNRTTRGRDANLSNRRQNFMQEEAKVERSSDIKIFTNEDSSNAKSKQDEEFGKRKVDMIKIPRRNNEVEDNSRLANFAHNIISRTE